MEEQETIEPEYKEIKKEHIIQINDNKIKIEINNDEIIFTIMIGISYYKYIRKYKYDKIKKELVLLEYKDIEKIYYYLIKSKYEIIEKEKKIRINDNKEIKLEKIKLTDEEMMKIFIEEIKDIKDKRKKDNELINELIKLNKDKDNKINILENNYNILKEQIYEIDDIINNEKYKDKINLVYSADKEGECNILGDEFVEMNKNNIELIINGKKSDLISKCKLKNGLNIIKMIIKNKIKDLRYMFHKCEYLKI